jgi:hypothetical protein
MRLTYPGNLCDDGRQAMPFDGVGFASDDRVSKLDQVISLLATPDKWCKGQFNTPDGRYCIAARSGPWKARRS